MTTDHPAGVDAGSFGEWLAAMRAVLRGERDADVPCGDCIGCCVSSYPIPLRPEDVRARAEVPEQFLLGLGRVGRALDDGISRGWQLSVHEASDSAASMQTDRRPAVTMTARSTPRRDWCPTATAR